MSVVSIHDQLFGRDVVEDRQEVQVRNFQFGPALAQLLMNETVVVIRTERIEEWKCDHAKPGSADFNQITKSFKPFLLLLPCWPAVGISNEAKIVLHEWIM